MTSIYYMSKKVKDGEAINDRCNLSTKKTKRAAKIVALLLPA